MSKQPDAEVNTAVVRHQNTPNAMAIVGPYDKDGCELIITTVARQSHVYTLTYEQISLLASQAELARISFKENRRKKKGKS